MAVVLDLEPELEARVKAQARERSLSVPQFLQDLIVQGVTPEQAKPPRRRRPRLDSPEEQARLRDLLLQRLQEAEEDRRNPDAASRAERGAFEGPYGQYIREKYRRQGFDV